MLVVPKKIQFNSKEDIVDYVTKGLPPKKANFDDLMARVIDPLTAEQAAVVRGKEVVIEETVIPKENRALVADMLNRVYDNRISNRNKLLIGFGLVTIAGIGTYCYCKYKKDDVSTPVVDARTYTYPGENGDVDITFF